MFDQYPEILSIYDAAEVLGTGKNRIYELVNSGKLKAFRLGNVWRIPKKSLEIFITESANL
ncbi:MAG: helix-turn-helix domain-containing protein [Clostridiales bacterium]|nr:helix-turn-helix domain-containing protein [Clostridiales bacterium]